MSSASPSRKGSSIISNPIFRSPGTLSSSTKRNKPFLEQLLGYYMKAVLYLYIAASFQPAADASDAIGTQFQQEKERWEKANVTTLDSMFATSGSSAKPVVQT
ncbi:hypothetical protein K1719_003640 [Acacia pycnantha]|nr:hypothetical protein K1719_003640 [Acacia pycnantha]